MSPACGRMLAIIAVLWLPLKLAAARAAGVRLTPARWLAFVLLWPGMDPAPFARAAERGLPGAARLARDGIAALAGGLTLWQLARAVFAAGRPVAACLLALPSLSLMGHFGVCNLAAAFWRRRGFDVAVPFDAPWRAASLAEFWGRRWNRSFVEMTNLLVYRPLAARAGRGVGLAAAFACSGALHELAISVPVGAGFGLPTAYFALHGALVYGERVTGKKLAPLPWLIAPVGLCFHPAFVAGVVAPLLG